MSRRDRTTGHSAPSRQSWERNVGDAPATFVGFAALTPEHKPRSAARPWSLAPRTSATFARVAGTNSQLRPGPVRVRRVAFRSRA